MPRKNGRRWRFAAVTTAAVLLAGCWVDHHGKRGVRLLAAMSVGVAFSGYWLQVGVDGGHGRDQLGVVVDLLSEPVVDRAVGRFPDRARVAAGDVRLMVAQDASPPPQPIGHAHARRSTPASRSLTGTNT